jgi:hypothetical protein
MRETSDIWKSIEVAVWEEALAEYWTPVKTVNVQLERALERLEVADVKNLSPSDWYSFLLTKYFPWKYTAPNRLATTTAKFHEGFPDLGLHGLDKIRRQILSVDVNAIYNSIETARQIPGIGPAGATGLLSLLYPKYFGTADVFVVEALKKVLTLPERNDIMRIKDGSQLSPKQAELLVKIMRRKAAELNRQFETDTWTPRKIDMVLWASRDKNASHC